MICPCKECARRGCGPFHDKCETYLGWAAEVKRANEERRKRIREDRSCRKRRGRFT